MGTQSTWGEQNRQYNKHNIISQTNIFLKMSGSRVPVTMRDFFFDDPFFKNSWEDFDKVRDAMFTESRDMWKKFDDDFRNMACMSNNIMLESDSQQQQQEAISNNSLSARSLHPDGLWRHFPLSVHLPSSHLFCVCSQESISILVSAFPSLDDIICDCIDSDSSPNQPSMSGEGRS